MSQASGNRVDLYDGHYARDGEAIYRAIRRETYGEDHGQTGWLTTARCDGLCAPLGLDRTKRLLEVACGAGGMSLHLARSTGASVVGVDVNPGAVQAANERARAAGLAERVRFEVVDADRPLPFPDQSFDAVFCNDAINHLRDRDAVLADWHRVLASGGRCLFTDPIVVTGPLSAEEMTARSSIGYFVFTPAGANEAALARAGFDVGQVHDLTREVADVSERWRQARESHADDLRAIEGEGYEDLQRFLEVVHRLSRERRLSRFGYVAARP